MIHFSISGFRYVGRLCNLLVLLTGKQVTRDTSNVDPTVAISCHERYGLARRRQAGTANILLKPAHRYTPLLTL